MHACTNNVSNKRPARQPLPCSAGEACAGRPAPSLLAAARPPWVIRSIRAVDPLMDVRTYVPTLPVDRSIPSAPHVNYVLWHRMLASCRFIHEGERLFVRVVISVHLEIVIYRSTIIIQFIRQRFFHPLYILLSMTGSNAGLRQLRNN